MIALLFLAGCGGGSVVTDSDPLPESQWTLMVFMAGDSDISQAAFRNINDMEEIGSTNDVQVMVQVEFSHGVLLVISQEHPSGAGSSRTMITR